MQKDASITSTSKPQASAFHNRFTIPEDAFSLARPSEPLSNSYVVNPNDYNNQTAGIGLFLPLKHAVWQVNGSSRDLICVTIEADYFIKQR